METIEITLPIGFEAEGNWYRNSRLRHINGADEEAINRVIRTQLPAQRTTAILARCIAELGPKTDIASDDVRALTIGDRDALLLHLRRMTFGDKIESLVVCPNDECQAKMHLDFSVATLLVPPRADTGDTHRIEAREKDVTYGIEFTLPTGADQEAVSSLVGRMPGEAAAALLRRCVREVTINGEKAELLDDCPPSVMKSVSALMAELDPQADVVFNVRCPTCQHEFQLSFDIGDYFCRELMGGSTNLYDEVHMLAFHYHWSEREIITMSRAKRRVYLNLLAEALASEAG